MGIVGEQDPATLVQLVKAKAAEYNVANGPHSLARSSAAHLVRAWPPWRTRRTIPTWPT